MRVATEPFWSVTGVELTFPAMTSVDRRHESLSQKMRLLRLEGKVS